jgi:hypothetical protein
VFASGGACRPTGTRRPAPTPSSDEDIDIGTSRIARNTGVVLVFGTTIPGTHVTVHNFVSQSATMIGPNITNKHLEMAVSG